MSLNASQTGRVGAATEQLVLAEEGFSAPGPLLFTILEVLSSAHARAGETKDPGGEAACSIA